MFWTIDIIIYKLVFEIFLWSDIASAKFLLLYTSE